MPSNKITKRINAWTEDDMQAALLALVNSTT